MMESREAAPERSSLDAEQFNMAASYLRSQFSVPHHLVPHYEDVKPTSLLKRRLSTSSVNLENHRFNPDISPYDSIEEDMMYKKSRAKNGYKKAQIYQMEKSESRREENSFQQILNKRKEIKNEIENKFIQRKVPRRKYMGHPRPPPPPPAPEKPGLLSTIFGFSRQKTPGYSRRNDPNHNKRNKINRRIDVGGLNTRRTPDTLPSKPVSTGRIRSTNQRKRIKKKPQSSGKQLFEGLELDFWEDETSLTTSPKPDYKRRWQNLTSDYIPKNQSATDTISDRLDSLSPVFSDWGSTMWAEIQEDWEDSDEQSATDLTARYLNAWADVSRIGTLPRPRQDKVGIKPTVENMKKPSREVVNNRTPERRKTPRRLRRPLRKRISTS